MVEAIALESEAVRVRLLAAVADPVRFQLLELLSGGTRCVCDLQPDPPVAGNLLSYHLKVLRDEGLVTTQRRGRWVDYTLAEDALERLRCALPGGDGRSAGSCRRRSTS